MRIVGQRQQLGPNGTEQHARVAPPQIRAAHAAAKQGIAREKKRLAAVAKYERAAAWRMTGRVQNAELESAGANCAAVD